METTKTPPPQPPPMSPQDQQELIQLRREKATMSAIIWNLVQVCAPTTQEIEVHPAATDPLWQLVFSHPSDASSGKVRLLAGTMPPIDEQARKRVVRLLRGTGKQMIDALKELRLPYPPSYVEQQVKERIRWNPETKLWDSVTPPDLGETFKNFVGVPTA